MLLGFLEGGGLSSSRRAGRHYTEAFFSRAGGTNGVRSWGGEAETGGYLSGGWQSEHDTRLDLFRKLRRAREDTEGEGGSQLSSVQLNSVSMQPQQRRVGWFGV